MRKPFIKEGLIPTLLDIGCRKHKKRAAKAALKVKQGEKSDFRHAVKLPEPGRTGCLTIAYNA
jgi:hypothetical protein